MKEAKGSASDMDQRKEAYVAIVIISRELRVKEAKGSVSDRDKGKEAPG